MSTELRSRPQVEHDRMNVDWSTPPDADYCRTCGPTLYGVDVPHPLAPGVGGAGGIIRGWQRVVVDERSWNGDVFLQRVIGE